MSETFPEENRCADLMDQASQTELRMRENDVALARAKSAPEQVQLQRLNEDGKPCSDENGKPLMYWPITECVDCESDIPAGRLALAKVRCIVCQGVREKRNKQRA